MSFVPLLLAAPLAGAFGVLAFPRAAGLLSALAALATAATGLVVATDAFTGPPRRMLDGVLYVDALSGLIVLIVSLVGPAAVLHAVGYLENEVRAGHVQAAQIRWFHLWLQLSIAAMLAVPVLNNLGLLWVAIEATTLTTALLVAFFRTGHALEAAWKYLMLCAVGIAFALFGVLLMYFAAGRVLGAAAGDLQWDVLRAHAAELDPRLVRLAFVLTLVGFGTKAGLAPMHTWLPDAHGQAPTPVSVVLSGALLNCALYAILRFHLIAAGTLGGFSSDLLLVAGGFSVLVAVPFILVQHDLKRLLAYSSVEHIGIVALGVGIGGPLGLAAASFHMLNHALAKSTLFFAAGAIGQRYGTLQLPRLRGAIEGAPLPAVALLIATLALGGTPPFAPFASEFGIARAGFAGRPGGIAAAIVLLLTTALVFGGMLFHVLQVVLRTSPRRLRPAPFPLAPIFLGAPLGTLLLMGLWLPPPLAEAFGAVARVLEVAP